MKNSEKIIKKIADRTVTVGIIGLGYVGLPLAVSFARKGVKVLGFDKSGTKVRAVNEGRNYIADITDEEFARVHASKLLEATEDFARISEADAVIICVPTPLDKYKKPDMSSSRLPAGTSEST